MAKDNITPIYGEWLCKNIKYYRFFGNEAEDLKKRLESIDVSNVEYDEELVICYRKFLQLFHNNMFETALCPPKEGITTTHIKAFLAPNAYGVMTPIEFLEENHGNVQYDFDTKIKEMQSPETKSTEAIDYKTIHEDVAKITAWKKNKFANLFRCVLAIALVIFCAIKSIDVFELLSHDDYQTVRICVTVVLVIGAWRGLAEFFAALRKKKFFKAVEICNSAFLSGETEDSKANSQLDTYKELLQKAMLEGNPTELSEVFGKKPENNDINKQVTIVKKVINNDKRIKKKAGIFTFLFLLAATYFLLYGYNEVLLLNKDSAENYEEALTPTTQATPTEEAKKEVARTKKLMPVEAVAKTERVSSKGTVFGVDLTLDDDAETCWQDGSKGDGTQEWLSYYFGKPYAISSISILNGRVISEEKYYANGRIKEVTIYFNKQGELVYQMQAVLEDVYNVVQTIGLVDYPYVEADEIIIVVDSIYQGTDYTDLCVTEVSFTHTYYEYE